MEKNKEYILCAAIWYKELPSPYFQCSNINKGLVMTGHRHGHIIQQMKTLTGLRSVRFGEDSVGETVQGFLTSKNRFLDRNEARELFIQTGGNPEFEQLYSEDLY